MRERPRVYEYRQANLLPCHAPCASPARMNRDRLRGRRRRPAAGTVSRPRPTEPPLPFPVPVFYTFEGKRKPENTVSFLPTPAARSIIAKADSSNIVATLI